jgi:spermidine/putrescine transport system substrate-binding protein
MRLTAVIVLTAGAAATLCSCSKPAPEKQVIVLMWSEYIDRNMLADFEKHTGMTARIDEYENTEEMIAKLQQAGGTEQYDVVVASDHAIPVLAKLALIQPLELSRIPNARNVSERFRSPSYDPGGKYSLPYQWGTMGLMYRKDRVRDFQPSWALVFERDRQPGPFVLIDSMRDMLAAALKYGGKSINSRNPDDLKSAGERLLAAKKSPHLVGFEAGVGGKNKVVSGDAVLAIVYSGDAIRAMEEDENVAFALPTEGTLIWVDAMTIPAQARNREGACQFINWILDPATGAKLSNFNRYATPNQASLPLINKEDRENRCIYPDEQLLGTFEYLEDLGGDTRLYDEVWTAVKSR